MPAASVPTVARECAVRGVRALLVVSAGFAEAGPKGAVLQDELLAICRASGMRLVGPNCLGVMGTRRPIDATSCPTRHRRAAWRCCPRARCRLALIEQAASSASGFPRSSRSGTGPTSRPTTSSSTGRKTIRPTCCCSTLSRSGTRATSCASRAASAGASRSSRYAPGAWRRRPRRRVHTGAVVASSEAGMDALLQQTGGQGRYAGRASSISARCWAASVCPPAVVSASSPTRTGHPVRRRLRGERPRAAGAWPLGAARAGPLEHASTRNPVDMLGAGGSGRVRRRDPRAGRLRRGRRPRGHLYAGAGRRRGRCAGRNQSGDPREQGTLLSVVFGERGGGLRGLDGVRLSGERPRALAGAARLYEWRGLAWRATGAQRRPAG